MKESKIPSRKSVYLIVRNEHEFPKGHRVVKFSADSILDWVQEYWITSQVISWQKSLDSSFNFASLGDDERGRLADSLELKKYTKDLVGTVSNFNSICMTILL